MLFYFFSCGIGVFVFGVWCVAQVCKATVYSGEAVSYEQQTYHAKCLAFLSCSFLFFPLLMSFSYVLFRFLCSFLFFFFRSAR